jgi:hypothetical protein
MKRMLAGALLAVLVAVATPAVAATSPADAPPERLFAESVRALEQGAHSEAIDQLELLADRGFVHPDASFNRGVAYLGRARGATARPGDYGRSIAGFIEALSLRPDDASAADALAIARSELEKQRARAGATTTIDSPPLSSAIVDLVPENVWALLALAASLTTTVGLSLFVFTRRGTTRDPASAWRLTGAVLASVGALCLAVFGAGAWFSHHLRMTERTAVVVAQSARLLDERGRPTPGSPLSEGTAIRVLQLKGQLALVESGQARAWLRTLDLQMISTKDMQSGASGL